MRTTILPLLVAAATVASCVGQSPPAKTPPAKTPPAKTPPAKTPLAKTPLAKTPPARTPPKKAPPKKAPPKKAPPAKTSPTQARPQNPTARPAAKPAPGPAPAQLDAVAKRILAAWRKRDYHPGRAGVRTVRFDIEVRSRGGMTGTWKAKATYAFDRNGKDRYGTLKWNDEEVATAMTRRGWNARAFARDFDPDALLHGLAGTRVVSKQRPNGTILQVVDEKAHEPKFLMFDKKAVHIGTMVGPMLRRFYYEPRGEQLVRSGETYKMTDADGDLTVWSRDIQGFHVPVKIHEVVKVKGQVVSDLTFVMKNHAINGGAPARSRSRRGKKTGTDARDRKRTAETG